ncbi:tRNA (adenosine(37)-N6)-threonylcarbamoyltransferase complex dimerization subunit type 1 TsaB [Desulfonatronovibrio magnus]|uniref:tRNA (adenosine(37)-N6)-threonylcarbamoyltransferase complex dimerization subunit type 1 TsaB n=1 Tax=Desulfonatronovibrio magnus TaxID=698827 RepID=UPI0005EBAF76|nr:tRNA (adenosine(37)-N6)-threonylcarbamoyltransferase complex dimerization subunit type 1 TsaB [Desulfonatronovibrio magnus]
MSKISSSTSSSSIHLVLNCAEAHLQVVFGEEEQVLWSETLYVPGRAMKYIAPTIKSGLNFLGMEPCELAAISCVEGPGSFTGIRMIFAHAMGMAAGAQVPMGRISYFDALAYGPGKLLKNPLWIFVHSRIGQVYAAAYKTPGLELLYAPANIALSNVAKIAGLDTNGKLNIMGSGVRRNSNIFKHGNFKILDPVWDKALPESLLCLTIKASKSYHYLLPRYLRASDAEENLAKKNNFTLK